VLHGVKLEITLKYVTFVYQVCPFDVIFRLHFFVFVVVVDVALVMKTAFKRLRS